MQDRYFSDEELVAYLDGETEYAPAKEIALALKTDVGLAKRLDALRVDTHKIAASFGTLKPGHQSIPLLPMAPKKRHSYEAIAASAILALAIGFGGGYALNSSAKVETWQEYAAAYHYLYTTNTLAPVNRSEPIIQEELTRVSAAVGKNILLDQLTVSSEIEYKRAQVLGFEGKALIQLAFLTSTEQPLALCIIRSEKGLNFNAQLKTLEGMSSASWAADGYEYILIGGTNDPLILRAAETLSGQIQNG